MRGLHITSHAVSYPLPWEHVQALLMQTEFDAVATAATGDGGWDASGVPPPYWLNTRNRDPASGTLSGYESGLRGWLASPSPHEAIARSTALATEAVEQGFDRIQPD
jgi:hypothetical protein